MQYKQKLIPFNLKHVEPIKIRELRISSRKCKRTISISDRNSSTEHGNSTAVSQKSMSKITSSLVSGKFESDNISHNNLFSGKKIAEKV